MGRDPKWVLDEVPTKLGSPFQGEEFKSDKPPVATPQLGPHYSSLLATEGHHRWPSNKPTNTIETFKNLFTTPEDKTEKTFLIATHTIFDKVINQEDVPKTSQKV